MALRTNACRATFWFADFQAAGIGHRFRRFPSGWRERSSGGEISEALFCRDSSANLPGSIRLIPVFDRSQSIVNSLHDVRIRRLMIAFVLVILVIFVFLGRATDTLIPAGRAADVIFDHLRGNVGARLFHQ